MSLIVGNNFRMSWLFTLEDVHLPSVYLRQEIREDNRVGFVKGRVSEALRVAERNPHKQQILPYYWFKYQDRRDNFLSKVSPSEVLEMLTSGEILVSIPRIYLRRKTRKTRSTRSPTSAPTVWSFGVVPKTQIRNKSARTCCNM